MLLLLYLSAAQQRKCSALKAQFFFCIKGYTYTHTYIDTRGCLRGTLTKALANCAALSRAVATLLLHRNRNSAFQQQQRQQRQRRGRANLMSAGTSKYVHVCMLVCVFEVKPVVNAWQQQHKVCVRECCVCERDSAVSYVHTHTHTTKNNYDSAWRAQLREQLHSNKATTKMPKTYTLTHIRMCY